MRRPLIPALVLAAGLAASTIGAATANAAPARIHYLALGDSYPAGVGVGPRAAYPAVLESRHSSEMTLVNHAVSGATTADVLEQATPFKADVVTLTVGADDLDWTTVLTGCVSNPTGCNLSDPALGAALTALPTKVAGDIARAQQQNPGAKILVTGYSLPFNAMAAGDPQTPCNIGPNPSTGTDVVVNPLQAGTVDLMVGALNSAVAGGVQMAPANHAQASYVDTSLSLADHQLCDPSPWLFDLNTPTAAFHLKTGGQDAYANAIEGAGF